MAQRRLTPPATPCAPCLCIRKVFIQYESQTPESPAFEEIAVHFPRSSMQRMSPLGRHKASLTATVNAFYFRCLSPYTTYTKEPAFYFYCLSRYTTYTKEPPPAPRQTLISYRSKSPQGVATPNTEHPSPNALAINTTFAAHTALLLRPI